MLIVSTPTKPALHRRECRAGSPRGYFSTPRFSQNYVPRNVDAHCTIPPRSPIVPKPANARRKHSCVCTQRAPNAPPAAHPTSAHTDVAATIRNNHPRLKSSRAVRRLTARESSSGPAPEAMPTCPESALIRTAHAPTGSLLAPITRRSAEYPRALAPR